MFYSYMLKYKPISFRRHKQHYISRLFLISDKNINWIQQEFLSLRMEMKIKSRLNVCNICKYLTSFRCRWVYCSLKVAFNGELNTCYINVTSRSWFINVRNIVEIIVVKLANWSLFVCGTWTWRHSRFPRCFTRFRFFLSGLESSRKSKWIETRNQSTSYGICLRSFASWFRYKKTILFFTTFRISTSKSKYD